MDNKNDDSAGSDSLDKSLQKKCVMDDVGQGEGGAQEASNTNSEQKISREPEAELQAQISTKKQKTERNVGDGGGGIGGTTVVTIDLTEDLTKSQQTHDNEKAILSENNINDVNTIGHIASSSTSPATTNHHTNFETKVKQISKNLKETTLAESANKKTSLEDATSSSSSSSSSTVSEFEQVTPSCSTKVASDETSEVAQDANESIDDPDQDQDHRSKKVRFHPDVKENDGGKRVIPKKKKKLKCTASGDDTTASEQRASGTDDEMDLDDEEEVEEEEEFDLAKTIAEAQDYLKEHPLTFVNEEDKSLGRLQNGLLDKNDLPRLAESVDDDDACEYAPPENGIERILGKHNKCGKIEFLLRYVDRPGLFWESEDFIMKQCPTLLQSFEDSRERRQERLMRHVAKRQNVRQHYTDF